MAAAIMPDPGLDGTVIEARRNRELAWHLAFDALDDSQDLLVGLMFALPAHGEAIEQADSPVSGFEEGFEHERVFQIAPPALEGPARGDAAVAALFPVEETAETAARIDARHAAPVDGPAAGNQRRGVAIGDKCIVAQGRITLVPHRNPFSFASADGKNRRCQSNRPRSSSRHRPARSNRAASMPGQPEATVQRRRSMTNR